MSGSSPLHADPEIAALLSREVPEIASGIVQIRAIARVPGVRTKVVVSSNDPTVSAVRACVGPEEARIRQIVSRLDGEPVDVIPWADEPERQIRRALAPLNVLQMEMAVEQNRARVVVVAHPFADASSTTSDLVSVLTGWDVKLLVNSAAA
jgi:transcription termination/antitermination protein NusA